MGYLNASGTVVSGVTLTLADQANNLQSNCDVTFPLRIISIPTVYVALCCYDQMLVFFFFYLQAQGLGLKV